MKKNLPKELIQLIRKGGFTVNHGKGGAKWNRCSLSLPSFNFIFKGQYYNQNDSKNVVLSLFRANTDELLGKRLGYIGFFAEVVLTQPIFTVF
jgi:hypothetical protein